MLLHALLIGAVFFGRSHADAINLPTSANPSLQAALRRKDAVDCSEFDQDQDPDARLLCVIEEVAAADAASTDSSSTLNKSSSASIALSGSNTLETSYTTVAQFTVTAPTSETTVLETLYPSSSSNPYVTETTISSSVQWEEWVPGYGGQWLSHVGSSNPPLPTPLSTTFLTTTLSNKATSPLSTVTVTTVTNPPVVTITAAPSYSCAPACISGVGPCTFIDYGYGTVQCNCAFQPPTVPASTCGGNYCPNQVASASVSSGYGSIWVGWHVKTSLTSYGWTWQSSCDVYAGTTDSSAVAAYSSSVSAYFSTHARRRRDTSSSVDCASFAENSATGADAMDDAMEALLCASSESTRLALTDFSSFASATPSAQPATTTSIAPQTSPTGIAVWLPSTMDDHSVDD